MGKGKKYIHKYKRYYWEILIIGLFILSWFVLFDVWANVINTIWVKPIMGKISENLDWYCLSLIISITIYYFIVIKNEKVWNEKRFWILFCIAAIYLRCFFSNQWMYTSATNENQWLCYSHLIILPILCEIIFFIVNYRKKKVELIAYEGLEYSTSLKSLKEKDSYKRNDYVESLSTQLKKTFHQDGSFAIGIVGNWGTGKTSFIQALKKSLENDVDIVIEFKPWYCKSPEDILQDFFILYQDEISFFVSILSSKLQYYVDGLLENDDSKILKLPKLLFGIFGKKTTQDWYEEIKRILIKAQIKVLVVIDDLDRLNNDEVIEILRLIRNSANFPFTQFIVAYDKNYVINTMSNSNIINPIQYLEKIFNMEINLPKFEERIICEELHSRINSYLKEIHIEETLSIRGMIYLDQNEDEDNEDISYIAPQILSNMRDVIRFVNSFKINLQPFVNKELIGEIVIRDFYFLELIRYGFPEVYIILRDNPLRILDVNFTEKKYTYKIKLKEDEVQIDENELLGEILDEKNRVHKQIIAHLLRELFAYNQSDHYSYNIWHLRSYGKYFSYRIDPQTLTFADILLVIDDPEALTKVEEWEKNKKWGELEDKLTMCFDNLEAKDTTYEIQGKIEFKKASKLPYEKIYPFIKLLLSSEYSEIQEQTLRATSRYINRFTAYSLNQLRAITELWMYITKRYYERVSNLIDNGNFLVSLLYKNNLSLKLQKEIEDTDRECIKELLIKTECPEIITSLINSIIHTSTKDLNEENMILSIQTLKEIQLEYLKSYISQFSEINQNCFYIFNGCIESIDENTKKIKIMKEALVIMRNFIQSYPQGYISLFIRKGETSNEQFNIIAPEPAWKQLFQSTEDFENFLYSKELDTCTQIECVRNFWQLYKYNKYNPLEFVNQGVITEIINSNFINEMVKLKKLIKIKAELKELSNKIKNNEWPKGTAYQELEDIENKFKVIDLYISLSGEIREQIDIIESDFKN